MNKPYESICTGNVLRMIMKKHSFDVQVERIRKYLFNKTGLFQITNFLERSIKNWPISRAGYQFQGKCFLERGANLESRAAHTHPKNTEVRPRAWVIVKRTVVQEKTAVSPLSPPLGMFHQERSLRLSDKNSILLT